MKKCLTISGGDFEKIELNYKYDFFIACDKGYVYAKKLNIKPNIIVGDFDSAKKPKNVENVIKVSKIKDDTDTSLAVKYALKNGYKDIDIICALGGRIDHTLANISLMKYVVEHKGVVKILSNSATLMAFTNGKIRIKKESNKYLSIFSLSDKSKIDYIKGTKYDIKNLILKSSFPLGVSNEFKNKLAEIKIGKGVILIILIKTKRKG